jgi:hypothetical protein
MGAFGLPLNKRGLTMRVYIRDYNYRHDKFNYFGGDPQKDLLLGIELEVERTFKGNEDDFNDYDYSPLDNDPVMAKLEKENDNHAGEVLRILNGSLLEEKHVYIKQSLSIDDGFKIVSHPATLDYHLSSIPWDYAFEYLTENGYYSDMSPACSLHIHINKGYLGDTPEEIILTEERLLYFFERYWDKFVLLSRREKEEIFKCCLRRGHTDIIRAIKNTQYKDGEPIPYAINFNKKHSVEIKLFKGTLTYRTFMATLTLVAMIAEYCKYRPIKDLVSWRKFEEFLWKGGDITAILIDYMKERYVWEPLQI